MTKKNNTQYLKAKREAFIKLYVDAKIKWISKSINPTFEVPSKKKEMYSHDVPSKEKFSTLYEKIDTKNFED